MRLTRGHALAFAGAIAVICMAVWGGAVFGALGRHSVRFPLGYTNDIADSIWALYQRIKNAQPPPVVSKNEIVFPTVFLNLRGRVFEIPISDRGGEGGGLTSIGETLLLMTHDGRFFAGTPDESFRRQEKIRPPPNGYQHFVDVTHRPPFDPAGQNYANFRYNGIAYFNTSWGAGLLLSYTYFNNEKTCYTSRLSRFDFPSKDAPVASLAVGENDWKLLFETSPCLPLITHGGPAIRVQEAGGAMLVDNVTGKVILTSGDYDTPKLGTIEIPQDPTNDYGKTLELDIATGQARHITMGHRDAQGITKDKQGRIWTVEHGPRGGDELNHIIEGRNYGYPLALYGTEYSGEPYHSALSPGRHDGFEQPTLAWTPSIAPSTVLAVRGFDPAWDGDLLVGTLRSEMIVHIRLVGDRVVFAEQIPVGRRVRTLFQYKEDTIILWNGKNQLIALKPKTRADATEIARTIIQRLDVSDRVRTSVQAKVSECMQCHSFDAADSTNAPSLARVFGSGIGSTDFANYSEALKEADGTWTRERLNAFLRDPEATFPGTAMPNQGLDDDDIRAGMVEFLATLSRAND
jgi:cytochrome c2